VNSNDLRDLLTCPVCRDSELVGLEHELNDGALTCGRCGASYPVRGGIPILPPPGFDPLFQGIVPKQPPGGRMVA